MHSSEQPAVLAAPPAGAPTLRQLGRVIVRARSASPATAAPSTSRVHQPRSEPLSLEQQLDSHVEALWTEGVPLCIEVFLASDCAECSAQAQSEARAFGKPSGRRGLLLERWTMAVYDKNSEQPPLITAQWLLSAVRSQLHFSQLSAWIARIADERGERRRKLSREYKKPEPTSEAKRSLNITYSIRSSDNYSPDFSRPPQDHTFSLTDIGSKYLKLTLHSLPRTENIPIVECLCKKTEDLVDKFTELNLVDDRIDDRMHNPCAENCKHKCSIDEDDRRNMYETRLKERAKQKRRLRKERKTSSSNSEGDKKGTTSIPILQASKFDRFRAIGFYRNQTYLTVPRIQNDEKKYCTVGTQTDNCECGGAMIVKCGTCDSKLVRSPASFDLKNCDTKSDTRLSAVDSKIDRIVRDRMGVPSASDMQSFRWRFDSAASMIFHSKTGLPLTSSPAPLKRGSNCFDYDDSINGISGIKSALFHPIAASAPPPSPPPRACRPPRLRNTSCTGLLGSFEESALQGRLEAAATVHGFVAELGASGAFCPQHRRLPVAVLFYAPGGTNAPYMGHINLGPGGYRVPRSGTVQVSLFNPHGTLVKMFVVLYDLTDMPVASKTFLRQRTLYLPAGSREPPTKNLHEYMRYLIHLRFMTSKSGKLYLHTDIKIIVSRKADLDAATAHSAILKPTNQTPDDKLTNGSEAYSDADESTNHSEAKSRDFETANHKPCRVFGGCSEEIGYEKGVAYELRSFTYGPENPKYSPR